MKATAYLSNISPLWPFDRQEQTLAAVIEGWPHSVQICRDELDVRSRRAHVVDRLVARENALRPTTRRESGLIYVASLAVFAWSVEEMLESLTRVAARRSTLFVVDAGLQIGPKADAALLHQTVKAFAEGRRSRSGTEAGLVGSAVSAKRRIEASIAAADLIRDEWKLPSKDFPTSSLLERSGLSPNTAKIYLGVRKVAQALHMSTLKRQDTRRKNSVDE